MAEESSLVRDVFNRSTVTNLAERIQQQYPAFNVEAFVAEVVAPFPDLSYTQRADAITNGLEKFLPDDHHEAVRILVDMLPPEGKNARVTKFQNFLIVPLTRYISRNGLEYFDLSMRALKEMTKRLTAEWDIRPFIIKYREGSLALLKQWAIDKNQHVRRLVSEGTRPRLPWGMHLKPFIEDPTPVLELLELLKDDPELYVRRSVANNLNDIAKDHPDKVVETLLQWQKDASAEREWIIKHASRTLVKQGHPEALSLLGYNPKARIKAVSLTATPVVDFGKYLEFDLELISEDKQPQNLVIDYAIHFMKANGQLAPKVFKLKTAKLAPGDRLPIKKRHPIKPITTRTYYPGKQELAILVNGQELQRVAFELRMGE